MVYYTMANSEVLIFGVGQITVSLIKSLIFNGHKVVCVTDNYFGQIDNLSDDNLEVLTYNDILQNKYNIDAVIFSWNDHYKLARNDNAIAKWLQSNMFESKRSFFLSSASVYGDSMTAHSELCTNIENNEKLLLEKSLSEIFFKKKTVHTNLRISNVYGAGIDYGFIGSLLYSIQYENTVGIHPNLNTTRDYIHIDDVISAIEKLINIDTGKVCINISTGTGTTISQVLDIFANKGYKFENRKEITLTSKSKLISILDCSALANLIPWAPSTLATTIDKLIPTVRLF